MEQRDRGEKSWLQALGISPATAFKVPEGGYLLMGDNSPFSLILVPGAGFLGSQSSGSRFGGCGEPMGLCALRCGIPLTVVFQHTFPHFSVAAIL